MELRKDLLENVELCLTEKTTFLQFIFEQGVHKK